MKYITLLLLIVPVQQLLAFYSGLYVDDGRHQTIIDRRISRQEKQKFAKELLHLLGLPQQPRLIGLPKLSGSAPKFLLQVYNSLDREEIEDDFELKSEEYQSVKESDSIMTFLGKKHHLDTGRHEKGKHLWFDVSEVPVGDTVLTSELRLYKFKIPERASYTITVYQILLDLHGEKRQDYVDSMNITNGHEGWLIFNMTSTFLTWIAFPSRNYGIHISVHKYSKTSHEIHHDTAGIITSNLDHHEDHQPFLVGFLKYGANSGQLKSRNTRDVNQKKEKTYADVSYSSNSMSSESLWMYEYKNCQIQTLYVNFKDLNWQDWIIAPQGYAAYYCSGVCEFPLNVHMNATNHAIMQTLVNLIYPEQAPKPCCVPTKLGTVAVLYYLDDNNVILRKYRNMVVKSCGCH